MRNLPWSVRNSHKMRVILISKENSFLILTVSIAVLIGLFLVNSLLKGVLLSVFIALITFLFIKREAIGFVVLSLVPFDFLGLIGGRLSILKVLAFLYVAKNLFQRLIKRKSTAKLDLKIIILVTLYYGIWLISAAANGNLSDYSLNDFTMVPVWYLFLPIVLVLSLKTEKQFTLAIKIFFFLSLLEIFLGTIQVYVDERFYIRQFFFSEAEELSSHLRIQNLTAPVGTFVRPYDYASFILLSFCIIFSLQIGKQTKSKTYIFLLAILIFGIVMSLSRANILGLMLSIVLIAYYLNKYRIRLTSKIIVLTIAIILISIPALLLNDDLYNAVIAKMTSDSPSGLAVSFEMRKYLAYGSLLAFLTNPFLGVGPKNYADSSHIWLSMAGSPIVASGIEAHNAFGELFAEVGLLGGTIIVILLFLTYRNLQYALKIFRANNLYLFCVTLGILAYFLSQLIGIFAYGQGLVNGSFYIGIPLGFSLALRNIADKLIAPII